MEFRSIGYCAMFEKHVAAARLGTLKGRQKSDPQIRKTPNEQAVGNKSLRPLQGGSFLDVFPGLKPRA